VPPAGDDGEHAQAALPAGAPELTTIEVLGTSFKIRSSEDPADVGRALEAYRAQVAAVSGAAVVRDPLKVAIVAGLNLADALLRQQQLGAPLATSSDQTAPDAAGERIAARLIHELDRALEPDA
jgi:cell division protein ZapA (FtsZ GTPase activity inhibitor)